jgi:hypothetical protein
VAMCALIIDARKFDAVALPPEALLQRTYIHATLSSDAHASAHAPARKKLSLPCLSITPPPRFICSGTSLPVLCAASTSSSHRASVMIGVSCLHRPACAGSLQKYGWTGQETGSGFINRPPATLGVFASSDRF